MNLYKKSIYLPIIQPHKSVVFILFSLIFSVFLSTSKANQLIPSQAEAAYDTQKWQLANTLFSELSQSQLHQVQGLFGLARVAFVENRLDDAEDLIKQVLKVSQDDAEHLFWAGRISGKQAQETNIFSQLGYARDAKKYFTQALQADPQHQDAILGLIRFHQQAPVMAGSDKQSIPGLIKQLRAIDARAAFAIDAPNLLDKNQFESVVQLFSEALNAPSKTSLGQFKFNAAMWFSAYGHYPKALDIMQSIDVSENDLDEQSASMRLYQLAKLTAETQTQIELGIQNIQLYAALPQKNKTIPPDWIDFRLAQLQFLHHQLPITQAKILTIKSTTELSGLREKIDTFLGEYE